MRAVRIGATLSPIRLHRFVVAAGSPAQGLRLYRWNAQLASAYWTPLHFMEVAVRNAVHDSLSDYFGKQDWFEGPIAGAGAEWLYDSEREAVEKAISKLHTISPGKVVAELHFGFWVGLLSGRYMPPPSVRAGADYHDLVWVKGGVGRKFGGAKRGIIYKRLNRLRLFRNRIAHHEHLMGENLDLVSQDIDETLKLLDPATATWVRAMSDVQKVRNSRPC